MYVTVLEDHRIMEIGSGRYRVRPAERAGLTVLSHPDDLDRTCYDMSELGVRGQTETRGFLGRHQVFSSITPRAVVPVISRTRLSDSSPPSTP